MGYQFEHSCPGCRTISAAPKAPQLGQALRFRENQVCKLVSEGYANKAIATELHLCEGSVKEYMNRIFKKLGANNRTHAAVIWLKQQREIPVVGVAHGPDGGGPYAATTPNADV